MKTTTDFQKFIQGIIDRATDPSPDRYLDHVRVRNFGRPNASATSTEKASFSTRNEESCGKVSPPNDLLWGK